MSRPKSGNADLLQPYSDAELPPVTAVRFPNTYMALGGAPQMADYVAGWVADRRLPTPFLRRRCREMALECATHDV